MIVLGICAIIGWFIYDLNRSNRADEIRSLREKGWNGQPYQKIKTKNGTYAIWKNDKK